MKKKTLLSLLTGIAIVASTAGTYAAWDKLSDNKTQEVTLRNPVKVSIDTLSLTENDNVNGTPNVTGTATITTSDNSKLTDQNLTLTPEVTAKDGTQLIAGNDYTVNITSNDDNTLKTTDNKVFTSNKLGKQSTYNVTVTPTDAAATKLAGKTLDIKLTASLTAKATS